ncbi:response regulator, partial [bacterium]|nr:response regulator [bacterium]
IEITDWLKWVQLGLAPSIRSRSDLISIKDLFEVFKNQLKSQERGVEKRILVVDDVKVISKTLDRILTHHEYLVETASNGISALKKIMEFSPDLVILDIGLPGCDGFDVFKVCSSLEDSLKPQFLILSSLPIGELRHAYQYGVREIMEKPFQSKKLLQKIEDMIH